MNFKAFKVQFLGLVLMFLLGISCSLLVTPPEDYPPEEDTIAPQPPANLQVAVSINQVFRPAVSVTWTRSPDSDVLLYRIYRETSAENTELPAQLSNVRQYYDTDIVFPTQEGGTTHYRYMMTAIDSSGNFSNYSDSLGVTMIIPPVLITPQGTVDSAQAANLKFWWQVRYNIGKEMYIYLTDDKNDTLLLVNPVYGYDVTSFSMVYSVLRIQNNNAYTAPPVLPLGKYYWWVRLELTDEVPHPVSIAVKEFTIE